MYCVKRCLIIYNTISAISRNTRNHKRAHTGKLNKRFTAEFTVSVIECWL